MSKLTKQLEKTEFKVAKLTSDLAAAKETVKALKLQVKEESKKK